MYCNYIYTKMENKNDFELLSENTDENSLVLNEKLKNIAFSLKQIIESKNEFESSSEMIRLNARGITYKINMQRLSNLPRSRLGILKEKILEKDEQEVAKLCDGFDLERLEFYFDRDPFVLNKILNLYHTGRLHINHSECVFFIREELEYWHIEDYSLDVKSCLGFNLIIILNN